MHEPLVQERFVRGPGCWIGEFHCHPQSVLWQRENHIELGPLLVFPGTAVEISHGGETDLIADSNHAVFYNPHQAYQRQLLDPRGDHCVFFGLPVEVLTEIIAVYDPAAQDRAARTNQPYRYALGPVTARDYLQQRRIHQAAFGASAPDPLYLYESVLALFHAVIAASYQSRGESRLARPEPRPELRSELRHRHLDAVREMQRLLAARYMETLSLDDIADAVALSPFHAARLFREYTGATIHQYRNQIRLVAGLHRLREPARSLTDIALDLGYSSHSHFTAAFRRAFGVTPSMARHLVNLDLDPALASGHAAPE